MPEVRNVGFPIALIFVHVEILDLSFFDFLDLDEFLTVLLALLLPTPTTSFSVASILEADSDDLIVFNIEVSNIATLPKP